jgi:hypothetical protein
MIDVKKMGLSKPEVARGIDPHKPYRQSCLSIDGPAISDALYAHDIAILDAVGGMPGFEVFPVGTDLATTGTALKEFCTDRGATIVETGANAIEPALVYLRDRLFLIWGGTEETEMGLIDNTFGPGFDASNDAGLKLKDLYITGLVTDVPYANKDDVIEGGCLCLFVNDTTGAISVGAAGGSDDGVTEYAITGTTIINVGEYEDNAGDKYVTVDFVC